MIRFACPGCQMNLAAPPERAGARTVCPRCRQPVEVPAPDPEPESELIPLADPVDAPVAEAPATPPATGTVSPIAKVLSILGGLCRGMGRLFGMLPLKLQLFAAAGGFLIIFSLIAFWLLRLPTRPEEPAATITNPLARRPIEVPIATTPAPSPSPKRTGGVLRDKPPTTMVVSSQPTLVLDADGHTGVIMRALLTPDGQHVITVSQDKTVRVWDVGSGETVRILRPPIGEGMNGVLHAAAVSPDGKWLALAGNAPVAGQEAGPLYVISLETGELESLFRFGQRNIMELAFSADGKWLAAATADRNIRLYDFPARQLARVLEGEHELAVMSIAFSPDGQQIASAGEDRKVVTWSVTKGAKIAEFESQPSRINSVAWSPDGQTLATGSDDGWVRLYSSAGKPLKTFSELRPSRITIGRVRFAPNSKRVLCSGMGQQVGGFAFMLDLATGEQVAPLTPHNSTVYDCNLSRDGRLVVSVGGESHETMVWMADNGTVIQKLLGKGRAINGVCWNVDGRSIAWGYGRGISYKGVLVERSLRLDSLEFGDRPAPGAIANPVSTKSGYRYTIDEKKRLIVRSPQGQTGQFIPPDVGDQIIVATLLADGRVVVGTHFNLYVLQMREKDFYVRRLHGHSADIVSVAASPDGRYFATGSIDQTLRIWDPDKRDPLLSLFLAGPDWIAWTPEGYYAASPGGERLMGWHVNRGLEKLAVHYPAVQFRKSLYRPDVIRLVMSSGSLKEALAQADKVRQQATTAVNVAEVLPPEVTIISPAESGQRITQSKLEVRATARSVGNRPISALRLIVNGRPYGGQKGFHAVQPPRQGEVNASWVIELPPGKHTLAVQADSDVSKGMSSFVEVVRTGGSNDRPNLYVLAVGVSDYAGDMKLNYAASDADLVSRTLREQGGRTFQKVEVRLIKDKQATRAAILDGLRTLAAKMTPQDVAVIFLSGHGMRDRNGNFYFVPVDVDENNLNGSCLSGEQMKPLLADMPGRVLLLLDACHSGAAGAITAEARNGLADNLVRDLVTDDYGIIVMSSSLGREVSLESPVTRAGFFTYALAEALNGQADHNRDGYIHLGEVDVYTVRRVAELSKDEQHPIMTRPPSIRSFPLAQR